MRQKSDLYQLKFKKDKDISLQELSLQVQNKFLVKVNLKMPKY
jgi:hypothetical protein